MRSALYEPGLGYYSRTPQPVGRAGDFYTSASVGPVLGRLLAAKISFWLGTLANLSPESPLVLAEAGTHEANLAGDVIRALIDLHPPWIPRLQFLSIEPQNQLQEVQRTSLQATGVPVSWAADPTEACKLTAAMGGMGVFYANELLDAFPVRRWGWDATKRQWFEWHVGIENGRFTWTQVPLHSSDEFSQVDTERLLRDRFFPAKPEAMAALIEVLPDGFTFEFSDDACQWWRSAASLFHHGVWMALDYGLDPKGTLNPSKTTGTLRAFRQHRHVEEILQDPGHLDLTAHVDWKAIIESGEACGLSTVSFDSQECFLIRAAEFAGWMADSGPLARASERRQFLELTHPGRLGSSFQVLVQSRGLSL